MSYRLLLYEFCAAEGERLDYRLPSPIQHNNLPYDVLTYDHDCECPVLKNTSDGWIADLSCFGEEDCREVLLQVCRTRADYLAANKDAIVRRVGIGVYAEEMRRVQDGIEEVTVYVCEPTL